MGKRFFLKLDGIRGESQNPRHHGEIEIDGFSWGGKHQHSSGGPGKASINDLAIAKKHDRASSALWVACQSGLYIREAVLTIEEIAEWGSLIRATIVELRSLAIDSMQTNGDDEAIKFNFEAMRIRQA